MSETFSLRNLSVLNYANGFTHWLYKSDSTSAIKTITGYSYAAAALEDNFFKDAADLIAHGDLITVSFKDGRCTQKSIVIDKDNNTISLASLI